MTHFALPKTPPPQHVGPAPRRRRRTRLLAAATVLALTGGIAGIIAPATGAEAVTTGSTLSAETFTGATVPDSRWMGLGDSCLTAAPAGSAPAAGDSDLAGCTKTQDSPTNLGSGSDGFLQLTDNSGGSTAATVLNRAFPASSGLVMTFDQYQYAASGTGFGPADGIGFFLTDGSYTLTQPGPQGDGDGGALGYATIGDESGIAHGYLGLGLDVYGNYESQPYVGTSCTANSRQTPNSVTLRGSGNGTEGYCMIGTTKYQGLENAPATAPGGAQGSLQQVTVEISPTTATDPYPTVTVSINGTQVLQQKMTTPVPPTLKLGFAASTGGGHEVHLIRNVTVSTVNALGGIDLVKTVDHSSATGTTKTLFTQGDSVPYSFLVTNTGEEALTAVKVADPKIADIACPATTLQPADSFTCTGTYGPLNAAEAAAGSFVNTATVTGVDTDGETVTDNSSATIPTYQSAPLAITKHVTGDGAAQVAPTTAFTVNYSYPAGRYQPATTDAEGDPNTYPAGSGTLNVTNGGTATTDNRIPTGAVVTLHEVTPLSVNATTWGTPVFSTNPVAVQADSATSVTLDNPLAADPGSVAWSKTDSVSGTPLAGSVWSLTSASGFHESITDNGGNDSDSAEGALAVDNLPWGDYTLVETTAPTGYTLSTTTHTFTISATSLTVSLGAITNTLTAVTPPVVPPTTTPTPVPSVTPPVTTPPTGTAPTTSPVTPPTTAIGAAVNTGGTTQSGTAGLVALWIGVGLAGIVIAAVAIAVLRRRTRRSR